MKTAALVASALLLAACSGPSATDDAAVPRRAAYPRVAALSDSTALYSVAGVNMAVNADAAVSRPSQTWLDAFYPALGATLHIAVNRVGNHDELRRAVENRSQRIGLNLGGASASESRFATPQGFDCEIVTAYEGVTTPVQFMAAGPAGAFVSGTFVIHGSVEPADSVRPVVEAMHTQVLSVLNSLSAP